MLGLTQQKRSQWFTEPLAPGFRCPAVLGEEPASPPDDHWWSAGLACAWPVRFAGCRESPVADLGASPWAGAGLCRQAVCRFAALHAGGVRRHAGLPAARGLQDATTGQRWTSAASRPVRRSSSASSADLSLTCDVPAVDLPCTSRDGADYGARSKAADRPDDQGCARRRVRLRRDCYSMWCFPTGDTAALAAAHRRFAMVRGMAAIPSARGPGRRSTARPRTRAGCLRPAGRRTA